MDGGTAPPPQPAAPGCAKSAYAEPLPTAASLSGLTFAQATASDYLLDALALRFPLGRDVVAGGVANAGAQNDCVATFLSNRTSATAVLRQASTVVHECGHFFDLGLAGAKTSAYVVTDAVRYTCADGDTTSRGGKTFARSLLRTDAYYASRPACGGQFGSACDMYADIYLDGSPTDGTFQGGDQGYNTLLEETLQYVNSLATSMAFEDALAGSTSARDGILTFLWYVPRYLGLAREEYPGAYALLSGDACWRQATLTVWDRAWFYLDATKGRAKLGINDAALEALVKDPALVAEIDALRALECP